MGRIVIGEQVTPTTPPAGFVTIFSKSDHVLYMLDENGVETALATLPVADTTSIVEGSVDSTKQIRFEVGGITTGTVRVITIPDEDVTLVAGAIANLVEDTTPQLGGFLDPNSKYIGMAKGGDIASASLLVIDTDGDYFDVTGTTGFAAMTVVANRHFFLQFDGALVMTHDATNLDLPGEASITTAAGDVGEFFSTGVNTVQCVNYTKADGTAINGVTAAANLTAEGIIVGDGGAKGVKALATGGALAIPRMNAGGTALEFGTGGQIAFPATAVPSADPNTLDDYEEGTWTPILGGEGGTSGQTYSENTGKYIKIGKFISGDFDVTLTAKGTITNSLVLQGLPFSGSGYNSTLAFSYIIAWTLTAGHNLIGQLRSSTFFRFLEVGYTGDTSTGLTTTAIADNTKLTGSFSYIQA